MSLPELDLKKDEKSKLILSVAQKLKLAKKPWDDFAKIYHKYSQALLAVTAIGKQVTEQLNTIGALHKGDVGENITRLSGVQAAIDQKLEAISNCIEIELVTPIQNSLAPDQQAVGNFEKEFVKNSENIGSQLKKIEAQTKKVGKKGNNDDLMTVMSQFKNKITELDNWKSDSLKRVFLLERKRFCELLSHCCKVSQAELDLAQTISTYDTLLPQWNATVATAEVLPDELLKKFTTQGGLMQLTTAESASVQLANTTDQRIQNMHRVNEFAPPSDLPPPPPGSSGGYDSYEQPSYDNGDYSNNGYSNDYSSTDYGGYDAPDDVPPPPMSTPPPPPMSNPPPPPLKKMNSGPPSGPPSFTPRTPRDTMPPNSMPPPPPVKKMGGPPPGPPSFTPPPPMTNPAPPKITPRASQQMSPGPPKYAPPPPNVKAAAPPPPMNTPPPPPMSRTPPMPPKNAGGPPTPPSMPKSMSGSGGAPPPPPAPKAPGPPPPPPVSSSSKKSKAKDDDDDDHHHSGGGERNALLSSIHSFKKGGLKKAVTNDRSGPNLTQPKGGAGGGAGRGMPMMM